MKSIALLSSLLAACNYSDCMTRCGLEATQRPPGWSCEDVQLVEDTAQEAFKATLDPRLYECNLTGYHLGYVDAESWNYHGIEITGLTNCFDHGVLVGTQKPSRSALDHEMVHVLQGCHPTSPVDANDKQHSNWDRDGINDALHVSTAAIEEAGR